MTSNLSDSFCLKSTFSYKYFIYTIGGLILVLSSSTASMANRLELVKALAGEYSDNALFKDMIGAADADINVIVLCSSDVLSVTRVEHNNTAFFIKQFNTGAADAKRALMIEYKALELRHQHLPQCVPQAYLISEKHNCIVLEDIKSYIPLSTQLSSGDIDESALQNIIIVISTLHKKSLQSVQQLTTDFLPNPETEKLLKAKFVELFSQGTVSRLSGTCLTGRDVDKLTSSEILERVQQLYKSISDNRQTVIHGNLNAENIVVLDGKIKLCGNHYTTLGPCALDVGTLLSQYLTTYHQHMLTELNNDAHRQVAYKMIHAATSLVDGYLKELPELFDEDKKKEFVSNVAGYAGVELVYWAVSSTSAGLQQQPGVAVAVLDSGLRLINTSHRIHSAGMLVNIALMLTT